MQFDLLDARLFIPDVFVGRGEIRLSNLEHHDHFLSPESDLDPSLLSMINQWKNSLPPAPPQSPSSMVPFSIPLYHHRHVPSRNPTQDTSKPMLGYILGAIHYQWQSLQQQNIDFTIEKLLSPNVTSNFSTAVLENALKVINLSKATRDTLRSVFRMAMLFNHGMDRITIPEWLCGILLLQRYYEHLPWYGLSFIFKYVIVLHCSL
jgi:hypothetical protein